MTDTPDITLLRELFDEKLKSFDDKLKGVALQNNVEFMVLNNRMTTQDVTLARIELQTTKTNGRVTSLEGVINDVKLDEKEHVINCPVKEELVLIDKKLDLKKADTDKKLEELNVDLREYRFFKKYPKIAIGVLTVTCVTLVLGTWITLQKIGVTTISTNTKAQNIENTLKDNTKEIKTNDSAVSKDLQTIDSLLRKK
jgi:hypothetical protein